MKTMVYGMQSSGASYVTFGLAQAGNSIAVIDLYCEEDAPPLCDEAKICDVIVKCVVTAMIPLEQQLERFKPNRLVLVTRNVDDIIRSLDTKAYRNVAGSMEEKLAVYDDVLLRRLHLFDEVISYERFVRSPLVVTRSPARILAWNAARSCWCRRYFGEKWAFGGLRDVGAIPVQLNGVDNLQ